MKITTAELGQDSSSPHTPSHPLPASPGVLVFSTAFQLLYMNGEARAFCDRLNCRRVGQAANGIVPTEVLHLCEAISKKLSSETSMKDWDQFQMTRIVDESLMLRGFGLPDPGGFAQSRLLVILEETDQAKTAMAQRAKDRFNLTMREQTAIIYLIKGLTNKEIASRMMIGEQTVKEHLRHAMEKTGTTTRTGLLAKIFLTDPVPLPQTKAFLQEQPSIV